MNLLSFGFPPADLRRRKPSTWLWLKSKQHSVFWNSILSPFRSRHSDTLACIPSVPSNTQQCFSALQKFETIDVFIVRLHISIFKFSVVPHVAFVLAHLLHSAYLVCNRQRPENHFSLIQLKGEDGPLIDQTYMRNKPFTFKVGSGQVVKGANLSSLGA